MAFVRTVDLVGGIVRRVESEGMWSEMQRMRFSFEHDIVECRLLNGANEIKSGDRVCLLNGLRNFVILREAKDYFKVVYVADSTLLDMWAFDHESERNQRWRIQEAEIMKKSRLIWSFSLLWSWDEPLGKESSTKKEEEQQNMVLLMDEASTRHGHELDMQNDYFNRQYDGLVGLTTII